MQEKLAFFRTKKGRTVIVGVLVALIVILLIVFLLVLGNGEEQDQKYQPYVDPISGVTIWNIDEEPELGEGEELILLGFYQLKDMGLMAEQYQKVIDKVTDYVEENYPDVLQVSYAKDSFKYLDEDGTKMSFSFAIGDELMFYVTLDTKDSLDNIDVNIMAE